MIGKCRGKFGTLYQFNAFLGDKLLVTYNMDKKESK